MEKGFGELFVNSWKEYGEKFIPILKIFLFLYLIPVIAFFIISAIIIIILLAIPGISSIPLSGAAIAQNITNIDYFSIDYFKDLGLGLSVLIPVGILFFILYITLIVLFILMSISFIHIGFTKETSVKKIIKASKSYFWKYVGLTLLISLALLGLFILLIIPGIIFSVFWIFSTYVLIKEKKGITESMKRSKEIVRGRWWRVFGFSLLLILMAGAVNYILRYIPFGGLVATLVITPYIILFFKNFYLDLSSNMPKTKKK